jgi:hypothetical protein
MKDTQKAEKPSITPSLDQLASLVEAAERCGGASSLHDLAGLLERGQSGFNKSMNALAPYCPEGRVFKVKPRQKPELTEGGKQLVLLAKEVLEAHRRIRRTHETVTLTVCCSQLTAAEYLPLVVPHFATALQTAGVPEAHLVIRELDTAEAFLDLAQRSGFDIALRGQAYDQAGKESWPFPGKVESLPISRRYGFGAVARKGLLGKREYGLLELFGIGPPVGVHVFEALEKTED